MGFYYEIESWKDIPMHKLFTLVEAPSYDAAIVEFRRKEKHLPTIVVKEAGKARYWIPAKMEQWTPRDLAEFTGNMKKVMVEGTDDWLVTEEE